MELMKLSEILQNAGVVGAGGAGFPSHKKLDKRAEVIILNCSECEPLFSLHRLLLEKYPFEILTALKEVKIATGADRVIIAVKSSYIGAIESVNYHLDAFDGFEVCALKSFYPVGDEVNLIYEATGRRVLPGNLPISVGATVFNVETMLNSYYAIKDGRSVTHKYVTVSGAVENPVTLYVPLGTSFSELIKLAGGYSEKDVAILSGGVMTGSISAETDVVTKTTNAVLVLPKTSQIISKKLVKTTMNVKRAMSSCCQCRSCTDLCSRHLLGYPIQPHLFMRAVALGMEQDTSAVLNSAYCSSCGICENFSCPQGLSPRTLIAEAKAQLRKSKFTMPEPVDFGVEENREMRLVSVSRLTSRLGISKYDVEAPISDLKVVPKTVKIKMSQHIGTPSVPTVSVGDFVKAGDAIADAGKGFSVRTHASIDGEVISVTEKYIVLRGANS